MGGAEDLFDLAADWVRQYYGGKGSPDSPEQCTQPSMTSQPVGHGTALLTLLQPLLSVLVTPDLIDTDTQISQLSLPGCIFAAFLLVAARDRIKCIE